MVVLYHLENISKVFKGPEEDVEIFKNLNMTINNGEAVAITGASGSGKSTLLQMMGALDKPTSGKIFFKDKNLSLMNREEQAGFRNRTLGFVFQFHHLLPEFSALENVAMPGLISGQKQSETMPRARELLERVGLKERMDANASTLSGGESQRAAIARALFMQPEVILADEPTGSLDEHTGIRIGKLLLELNRELGMALIIVTHNNDLARKMDRILELRSGALYEKTLA